MKISSLLILVVATLLFSTGISARAIPVDSLSKRHVLIKVRDSIPKARIGLKLGGSYNSITGPLSFRQSGTTGITAGGFMELRKKWFGLQIEAMVNTSHFSLQDSFINGGSLKFLYLDIPVLFQLRLLPGVWLQAGPQLGTLLTVSQDPSTSRDSKTVFQSDNISGVAGLEGKFRVHKSYISIGARYAYGLTNINSGLFSHNENWNTSSIQFYLGYRLF